MTKVAFTGAHGVGKTTITKALFDKMKSAGHSVSMTLEVPRLLCEWAGDPTYFRRGKNTITKQMLILVGQVEFEARSQIGTEILLCDRSLLDHWAYTQFLFSDFFHDLSVASLYERFVAEYCRSYDHIIYLPIEFSPLDDGTREGDVEFQRSIDRLIVEFLDRHGFEFHTLRGSVAERMAKSQLILAGGGSR